MDHTEFYRLVDEEFGAAYGRWIIRSHVLVPWGKTTEEVLSDGGDGLIPFRDVWIALCRDFDVPESRWLGYER